jgi:hypothetical protein
MRARNAGLALFAFVAACSSGPKYKIDDNTLASIPVGEKQGVLGAQTEQNQAREELRSATASYQQTDRDLDIAENEYKSAKLQLDTAKLNQKAAEASGDLNRKNQSERDIHVAEMGVKAADAKVDWMKKLRKFHDREKDAAEAHAASAGARVELEKAKLAEQKGIKPSADFSVMNFETESMSKSQKYSSAKLDADKMKPDVDDLERKYKMLADQYNGAKAH